MEKDKKVLFWLFLPQSIQPFQFPAVHTQKSKFLKDSEGSEGFLAPFSKNMHTTLSIIDPGDRNQPEKNMETSGSDFPSGFPYTSEKITEATRSASMLPYLTQFYRDRYKNP
jgi:hypothetical protein